MTLKPAELLALNKAAETDKEALKAARDKVGVGSHEVDFTVRVRGILKVAKDTESSSYPVDAWALLAASLNKLKKATGENISLADLVACAGKFKPETVSKLKKSANDVIKEKVDPVKSPKKGAVSPSLIVEEAD